MYRGFNLNIFEEDAVHFISNYYKYGCALWKDNNTIIDRTIQSFKLSENRLDGDKMSSDWFPIIDADVFISHSHNDEDLAIAIGGLLNKEFHMKPFIDSTVWKHSKDLLKMIDNVYCRNDGENTYSYQRRNYSTSHVHMMLSTALSKMIDTAECLLFLNTPASITPVDTIEGTESPWIYSELSMTRLIRKKAPDEHRRRDLSKAAKIIEKDLSSEEYLRMVYKSDLSHLTEIGGYDIVEWGIEYSSNNEKHPLDVLYELHPIIND